MHGQVVAPSHTHARTAPGEPETQSRGMSIGAHVNENTVTMLRCQTIAIAWLLARAHFFFIIKSLTAHSIIS